MAKPAPAPLPAIGDLVVVDYIGRDGGVHVAHVAGTLGVVGGDGAPVTAIVIETDGGATFVDRVDVLVVRAA